ncbi:MAG: hypothetical protein ACJ739_05895 [Acidimicrobiales bacterium]
MTDKPTSDARPSSLHKRLTVALANPADRARVAAAIAADLAGRGGDGTVPLVRAEDLWLAADAVARDHAEDRRALRARLDAVAARTMHDCDTARHRLEHLQGWRRTLVEGAAWARDLHDDLPRHLDAVEAVRSALDERRAEQRTAQQDLERVLEQRRAAAAAIEDADQELSDLAGPGMDETGLRRELEAAGGAVRDAEQAHADALAKLEQLQLEATGLGVRREAAQPAQVAAGEPPTVSAVRDALDALQAATRDEADRGALDLLEAWGDLQADLQQVGGPVLGATEAELDAARRRVEAAAATLAAMDAAASSSAMTAAERAALDAAHAEVLAAEEQIIGRRRVPSGARQRLDAAHAAERALLDRHGFGGYLDVVLSGGRSTASDPARPTAEREHFEASLALEVLERSSQPSPEMRHLRSERARLLGMVADLLGVDPGNDVEALLEAHRPAPAARRTALADALAAVGIRPVGQSLEQAALALLEAHPRPEPAGRAAIGADERRLELAAVEARAAAIEGELGSAQAEVDRTAEALQLAHHSVDAFEDELTVRAGEDVPRMKRFAAAEQLRAQIDAVAGTLRRAEEDARRGVEVADHEVAAAESTFEQAAGEVADLARRARKLAEELPIDRRPDGDPLRSLPQLVEGLEGHVDVLQPEIDKAEAAVADASAQLDDAMAACRLANAGGDGAQPQDVTEALRALLDGPGEVLVLDEPFVGIDPGHRGELLELVRQADRTVVLLTEEPEVLGWAIELPADQAAAMPADALLSRFRRSNEGLNLAVRGADVTATTTDPRVAPTDDSAATDVDITTRTTIDTDQDAAPTARRWAGQR